jgi:hypothetical protein
MLPNPFTPFGAGRLQMASCAPPACGGAGERSETEGEINNRSSESENTPSAPRFFILGGHLPRCAGEDKFHMR